MAEESDDDLYWDDNEFPTQNHLLRITESKRPTKSEEQQNKEWGDKKDLILQYFARRSGYKYLVIDIQKVINAFTGFSFQWKWSMERIDNALTLYNGFRNVVCCVGPASKQIRARTKCFAIDSIATEELIRFKILRSAFRVKVGIYSVPQSKYQWVQGKKVQTQIKTDGMSKMKQDMFGSIFGSLASQQEGRKDVTIDSRLRSGDVVELRLWRKGRDSKYCNVDVKHNKGKWVQYFTEIPVPVIPSANLHSAQDAVTFW